MNHTGISSDGPKCFGTQKRTSFVDIRDDDIPGPGTHNSSRIDRNTPTQWKFGNATERDSFLQKYPRPNPSPHHYNPRVKITTASHPIYSIPKSEVQNAAQYKEDDGCSVNYRPKSNYVKEASPKYSFGYYQEMNYHTKVPAPNTYRTDRSSMCTKSEFNKTQKYFTKADRPLPYGQQGKNPGVAGYELNSSDPMYSTAYVFGTGNRPNVVLGPDAPGKYYDNIGKNMKEPGKGFTMRPYYEGVKNKDVEQFPAANHYNPKQLGDKRKIINFTSNRSQLYNKDHIKYPSPQKYGTVSSEFHERNKAQSFTQSPRYTPKPNINPGPGTHETQNSLKTTKGYMGRKINNLTEFVNPGADHYKPNHSFNKQTPQRVVNYKTDRTDFSKSATGRIGPGVYEVEKQKRLQLGKMGTGNKYAKNRNKNPGPGYYQIPSSIGKLPKYYSGKKKITNDGFSTHALMMTQRARIYQQKRREEQLRKQEEEERLLNQEMEEETKQVIQPVQRKDEDENEERIEGNQQEEKEDNKQLQN